MPRTASGRGAVILAGALLAVACGADATVDAGRGMDAAPALDAGSDPGRDASADAGAVDAGSDGGGVDAGSVADGGEVTDAAGDAGSDAGADAGSLGRCAEWSEWICAGGGGMCRATCGGLELDCFGSGCECNLGGGLRTCAPPSGTDCDQCRSLLADPCCR